MLLLLELKLLELVLLELEMELELELLLLLLLLEPFLLQLRELVLLSRRHWRWAGRGEGGRDSGQVVHRLTDGRRRNRRLHGAGEDGGTGGCGGGA